MNNKGQFGAVGVLIIIAIGVIVAITLLLGGVTSNVATMTKTVNVVNQTIDCPNASATPNYVTLRGQAARGVLVSDADDGSLFNQGNWTVRNYVVNNGALESRLVAVDGAYNGFNCHVNYVSEPFGYDTNGGGRAITDLIIIFCAIAIAVFALAPILKNLEIFS